MRGLALVLALAACGGGTAAKPEPAKPTSTASELSPALAPLAWWLGDWKGESGTEHWVAAAGALYGVVLTEKATFEVMIVDDAEGGGPADGVLRLFAMPRGNPAVQFTHVGHTAQSVEFGNADHDDPKAIEYARTKQGLVAKLKTAAGTLISFNFLATPHVAAPELEAADIAFAVDAKARGAEGWASWFAPDGWMLRKNAKVEGAAIAETMQPTLSTGVLAWAPIASGKIGALGYTVGKATFTSTTGADGWKSSYVTIWKQQPDGTWKVLFDTGRGVNEP